MMGPPVPLDYQPPVPDPLGGETLGGVAEQMQMGQAPPMDPTDPRLRYQQKLQEVQQAYGPAMQPLIPEPKNSLGKTIGNVLSFGMMGLMENDYRQAYNRKISEQNADVYRLAANKAFDLIKDEDELERLGSGMQMKELEFALKQMRFQNDVRQMQLNELDREHKRRFGETSPLLSGPQLEAAEDQGFTPVPAGPEFPGRVRLTRLPGGGYAESSEGTPGAPPPAGAGPPVAGPGGAPQTPAERYRARKAAEAEQKAREKATEKRTALQEKPLEAESQKVVSGLEGMRGLIERALTEFTPEERRRYVGVFRNPANRAALLVQSDPKFQQWQSIVGAMQEFKFTKGGAALSAQEIATVEQFLPTGKEWGGGDEFETKAKEFYRTSLGHIRNRFTAARPRGALEAAYEEAPTEVSTTTTPTSTTTTSTSPVEGGVDLGLPPGFKVLRRVR